MGNVLNSIKDTIDARLLRPNGLYNPEQLKWEPKNMRKAVIEKKIAPFYPGTEEPTSPNDEECPICMLFYTGGLNRARCCKKAVCTECYFLMRPPGVTSPVDCPFCLQAGYTAFFTGPLSKEERKKMEEEERKVQELQTQMRLEEIERDRKREEERRKKKEEEQRKEEERKAEERKAEERKAEERKVEELKAEELRRMLEERKQQEPEADLQLAENIQTDPLPVPLSADDEDFLLNEAIRLSLMDANAVANIDASTHQALIMQGYNPNYIEEVFPLDASDSDGEQIH